MGSVCVCVLGDQGDLGLRRGVEVLPCKAQSSSSAGCGPTLPGVDTFPFNYSARTRICRPGGSRGNTKGLNTRACLHSDIHTNCLRLRRNKNNQCSILSEVQIYCDHGSREHQFYI